jgi:hypothetical protein
MSGCSETELRGAYFVTTPVSTVVAGQTYTYTARSAGVLPTLKTYSLLTAPAGMSVDSEGIVTWMPGFTELGVQPVRLKVSDGTQSEEQSWNLTVHQDLLFGVNYSPEGHTGSIGTDDEEAFAAEHKDFGKVVGYLGDWRDSQADAGTIPTWAVTAMEQVASNGFVPVIGFRWADDAGVADLTSDGMLTGVGSANDWTNQETRDEFLMMVEGFASTYKPRYLHLGYEVNTWALLNNPDWPNWLSQLEECTTAIKAVSPNTFVFTTFQLERMKGLGANQTWVDAAHWNLVDDLETAAFLDGVGFTSYPHYEYDDPTNIPTTYYDEIEAHWTGRILFSEIGWPAIPNAPFPGLPAEQNTMMNAFISGVEGLPVELAVWLYLHDFDGEAATPAHMGIGMRDNAGTVHGASEQTWKDAVELRERP